MPLTMIYSRCLKSFETGQTTEIIKQTFELFCNKWNSPPKILPIGYIIDTNWRPHSIVSSNVYSHLIHHARKSSAISNLETLVWRNSDYQSRRSQRTRRMEYNCARVTEYTSNAFHYRFPVFIIKLFSAFSEKHTVEKFSFRKINIHGKGAKSFLRIIDQLRSRTSKCQLYSSTVP